MNNYLFQSQRLGFRAWKDSDIPMFAEMNQDPSVMEFFPGTRTFEESKAATESFNRMLNEKGFCFFAVDVIQNLEFIGFIGLNVPSYETHFTPCIEIGWRLKTSAWNKGYATEGAKRCLEYGFHDLHFSEILSFTSVLNLRSERVMQKIGMIKSGEFLHPKIEEGHRLQKHVLYRISREE